MKTFAGLFLFLILSFNLFAKSAQDGCHKSTEGTDFWFGFMEGRDIKGNHYLEINVSARETTTFSVSYGPNQTLLASRTIQPGVSERVTIPKNLLEPIGSEKIENMGIHLVSEKPVNVFALNWDDDSNDAAVIYPTESLGTEYFAMCYTPSTEGINGRNSEFVVVATEDSTIINITPTVETDQHKPAGVTFSPPLPLKKGQLYQVQSMNANFSRQGDLTGTYISSNKPVALFSGSLIAVIPTTVNPKTGDHLFEQVPPLHAWGREFYTVQFKWRNFDRFRVLASKDNTIISVNTYPNDTLNRGEFKDYVIRVDQPGRILADKPIMVAQYSQSSGADYNPYTGTILEPFMTILSPIEQMRNSANFVVYQGKQTYNYFLIVITPASQVSNMRLDGKPIIFQNTGSDKYSFTTIEFREGGVHNIWNTDSTAGFLAYEYSYGESESYGYGVSFNLDPLLDLGENLDFGGDTLLLCYGSQLVLDAGPYFENYDWSTGDKTQKITISKGGEYSLTVTDKRGCTQADTVFVYLSHPVTDLGVVDTASCAPFSLPLDASGGFSNYLWGTGETTRTIIANKTGTYSVTVTDKYGCKATDSMRLKVFPIPEINYNGSRLICGDTTTLIQLQITGADPAIWAGKTEWNTDNPDLILSDKTDTSARVTVKKWGDYKISFRLATADGCDTTKQFDISFYDTPVSRFDLSDGNEECGKYSRGVLFTGTASPTANFNWDFGSSQIVNTRILNRQFTVSLGIGSNPEIKLVVEDHGCYSDTFRRGIAAIPNFEVNANPLRGCDSLKVSFSAVLPDQEKVDYIWDFGDGSTSNIINPKKDYSYPGFFDVGLTAVNQQNGCKAAFLFKDMIKVFPTPVANFSADQSECYDDSLNVIYLNNKDSSICTWLIQGGHRSPGNDSIRVFIDLPTAFIQLRVEEFGCQSTPVTIPVKRKPRIDFTTDVTQGCQPLTVNAVGVSNDGDIVYTWMLERQTIARDYTYQYFFPDSGRYDLGLIGYSQSTFCRDTILKPDMIWVHAKPNALFGVNFPVAYIDNPEISFINQSKDAFRYFWDFDDGNFSWAENPKHEYSRVGIYNPQLIVQSLFDCLDTTNLQINIIPFNVFAPNAFRPDSEIPENRYFMPVGPGIDPGRFNIKFFDRWGQLIFESFNMVDKWDGKTRNGKPAPMGNYVWAADYYDLLGFEHHQKGQVLLIR